MATSKGDLNDFKVNGTALAGGTFPAIKYNGATYLRESVDGSSAGRNQEGTMMRDLVAQKVKWELEFSPCTVAQMTALLEEVDDESFTFSYPEVCGQSSGTFYVGERSAPILFYSAEKKSWLVNGLKMNFIEM